MDEAACLCAACLALAQQMARPRQGSITSPQALVGVAAAWPTTGTAPTTAVVTRHGVASTEQPETAKNDSRNNKRIDRM
jgi:negative regulator of sigma E activity